ncbi:EAL domain-containing protein [Sulfurimonas lithotrophica]|uniref:EAL domain-containing protein n=1 Tax=Sulfurimonas lithotrophica TaxID=2590022 RepID=A0A5P8P0S0_9BACT|nr:HDOD domain-containing protein [Sulfurimonas lithotrophica]QFR49264.1 EAL domain-containing protein [Sulfurimonas lithotrophica]
MGNNTYIAKQPILNTNGEIFAYELLYRDTEVSSNIKNRKQATVSVLSSVINKFGVNKLLGDYKAFVKADKEFIMHSVINTIPKEYFIFSLQFEEKVKEKVKNKIAQLSKEGYKFAINDTILNEDVLKNYESIMEYISYIKIDVETPLSNMSIIKDFDIETIATKVENSEKETIAKKMDVDFVQGYFFAMPKIEKQEKFDSEVENIIRLCNKIMQDCSIDEIVDEFEKSPIISIQLLKFINSGLFHFRQKLSSIKQVVTLVGKTKLTQWLMLMIYSTPRGEGIVNTLLFDRVRSRTYLMQEIAKLLDKTMISSSYFVGVISLMDTLLGIKKRVLLHELHVDKEIKDAILKKDGILGEILSFAIALEEFNTEFIDKFIQKYNIPQDSFEYLSLNASGDLRDI